MKQLHNQSILSYLTPQSDKKGFKNNKTPLNRVQKPQPFCGTLMRTCLTPLPLFKWWFLIYSHTVS